MFCIPSVLLWGSGLMKEPLQLFAMCLVLWSFHKTTLNASVKNILYFIIAMMVLFFTRTYIFLAFVPGLIAWTIYLHYKKINCFVLFVACYAIMLTIALQLKHILPQYDIALMLYEKQIVYYKNAIVYNAQSLIPRITFAPSPTSVVKRSPEAVWLVLSQPYLWQSKSIWYYFSAIENILLIALIIYAIIKLDRKVIRENPLFAFSICFCITLFIIIGLTTPVVGAIVRYKVSGLLMLVVAIVSMKGSTLIGTSKPEV